MNKGAILLHAILIPFLLFSYSSHSQVKGPKYKVTGIVIDSAEKKVIPFATIVLFKGRQTVEPFKTIYSDQLGKFSFSALDTGNYLEVISYTGFAEKKQSIQVNGNLDLGTIELSPVLVILKGVNILSQKPLVELEEDKVIFNVENDPDAKTASTLDIFRKTPYLTVDGDDNVQLNGKSNFKILLNGRETSMFAKNVTEALRAFPGTLISKIEVMTTPPSKYDAEGVGGIINIVTRKKVTGYNGSVSTFNRTGAKNNNYSVNFNLKKGKFGLAFSYYLGGSNNFPTRATVETYPKIPSFFSKRIRYGSGHNDNFYNGGNLEISFELDSLNTIITYGNINGGHSNYFTKRTIITEFPVMAPLSIDDESDSRNSYPGYDAGIDYIRKFKKNKAQEFSIRSYMESGHGSNTTNYQQYAPYRYLLNNNKNNDVQWTIQSDLTLPFSKNRKLESGMKFIYRNANADYQSLSKYDPALDFMSDPFNSDYFKYTQIVFAAYSTYSFKTKKSTFRIGARLEFTGVDGDFVSSNTTIRQRYANLVPFFQSIKKLNPKYTSVLTYTQRLSRPYIWILNPFVNNIDTLNISYGNPNLAVQTLHYISYELRYQKGATFFSTGLQLEYTNNYITDYSSFNPPTGVTKTTSDNIGRGMEYRLNTNLNSKLNSKWSIYYYGGLYFDHNRVRGHPEYNSDGLGGYFNAGYTYIITKKISWSGSFNLFQGPPLIQNRYPLNIWYNTTLTFKLFKEKLNMSVRTINFLKRERKFVSYIEDQYFKTTRNTYNPFRGLVLTLNWNFGKLKENVSKKKGVSNDDLLNKADGN